MVVQHTQDLPNGPSAGPTSGVPVPHTAGAVPTVVAATGALAAGVAGLLLDNPYPGPASTEAMFRGYDIVNVLAALALATLIASARRGRQPAVLARASLLAYLAYTYAYYLFGTGFNDLLLLHVTVFTASLAALTATAPQIDLRRIDRASATSTRSRVAAVLLAVLAAALGGMWVYFATDNAVTGDIPAGSRLVETDTIVHLGMALDLALLVPWYATAAVLLWRHRPAGRPVAVVALVAGLLHQVSYIVAMPVQVAAEIPGAAAADPGESVVVLIYGVALALLINWHRFHMRRYLDGLFTDRSPPGR